MFVLGSRFAEMADRVPTAKELAGRKSVFDRRSLFDQQNNKITVPSSEVGGVNYGTNVNANGRKNMAQRMSHALAAKKIPIRNVRDKANIEEQKRIILGFLKDKNSQLDPTCLTNPTAERFQSLFQFIYSHLDPHYRASPFSIREEFPEIMKNLQYPSTIKVSTMQSISSATSWPYVLDALGFLVTFVEKLQNLDVMSLAKGDEAASRRMHAYGYLTKCFNKQKLEIINKDSFKPEFKEFRENVMRNENMGNLEVIEKEKIDMQDNLEKLRSECVEDECNELEEMEMKLNKEISTVASFIDEANEVYQSSVNESERLQKIVGEKGGILRSVRNQIVGKRDTIKVQPISGQKARDTMSQLAKIREQYKYVRASCRKFEEESTKLQGELSKVISSIRSYMSSIGKKIGNLAANFYTPEDHSRLGFSDLHNIDGSMDVIAAQERLLFFEEMYTKLVAKITEDMQQNNLQIQQNKKALGQCVQEVERLKVCRKKYIQDRTAMKNEKQRYNDELKFKKKELEAKEKVLNEKQNLADEKFEKVMREIEQLQILIDDAQVKYGTRKHELEETYGTLVDTAIDKIDTEYRKHSEIRSIQKRQDDVIDALLNQHEDLLTRVTMMEDDDDETSE